MLNYLINHLSQIPEVIVLLNKLSNENVHPGIRFQVLNGKFIPLKELILLYNYYVRSPIEIEIETYGDLNFNELAFMMLTSDCCRTMSDYSVINMESPTPIVEEDFLKVARIISENTNYEFIDILNDFENRVTLSSDKIEKYGIVHCVESFQKPIKVNSSWKLIPSNLLPKAINK